MPIGLDPPIRQVPGRLAHHDFRARSRAQPPRQLERLVPQPQRHQMLDQLRAIFRQLQRQHQTAAQEGRRQFPLLVGGEEDQRAAGGCAGHGPIAPWHREALIGQTLQQRVRQVRIGLVNLVDQQHGPVGAQRQCLRVSHRLGRHGRARLDRLRRRTVPVIRPPERFGAQVIAFWRQRQTGPVRRQRPRLLRIGQPPHGVKAPHQVVRLGAAIDHDREKAPVGRSGRRAGGLALADARLAADQQRPARCLRRPQGHGRLLVEAVDAGRPRPLRIERNVGVRGIDRDLVCGGGHGMFRMAARHCATALDRIFSRSRRQAQSSASRRGRARTLMASAAATKLRSIGWSALSDSVTT